MNGESDPAALRLPPSLGLTAADALHGALQHRVAHGAPLVIDGSDVELVSTACLQLLVAAAARAQAIGAEFRLIAPSAVLAQAVRDLALADSLGVEAA
jgi:anti-anti-sigma regulatory factor